MLPGLPDRHVEDEEPGAEPSLRDALAAGWRELALYLGAGVGYVLIGVSVPEFLFTWVASTSYLLVCVVVLPFVVRRMLRWLS